MHLSMEAYKSAIDELVRRFPNDPSVALIEIDGAFLRGDFGGALHAIDVLDGAVGPDPFLDGMRAMILAARKGPGDLDAADAKAENAMRGEPSLPIGFMAQLAIRLGRHEWTKALEQMDLLGQRFDMKFDDRTVRTVPMFEGLAETTEYATWRAQHP